MFPSYTIKKIRFRSFIKMERGSFIIITLMLIVMVKMCQCENKRLTSSVSALTMASTSSTSSGTTTSVGLGFPSQYFCSGRIFDEPRSLRLKCTKNSRRLMNCQCTDPPANSRLVCNFGRNISISAYSFI